MEKLIPRISAIEIPVSNLENSINWYIKILGLTVQHKGPKAAMLTFDNIGVPGIYLCETEDTNRIHFLNTSTGVTHSVIDFYTADLQSFYDFLVEEEVEVGELNIKADFGGFGFKDPDGNLLSACNAIQKGQI